MQGYRAEIAKRPPGQNIRWLSVLPEFFAWRDSLSVTTTPVEDERPWLTFGAIRRLAALLPPAARIFEYGAGGSTLYFLKRGASVVTVEHDRRWLERVALAASRRGYGNWSPLLRPPVRTPKAQAAAPDDPNGYVSTNEEFRGYSFEDYARAIDSFEDGWFDLVLVDGRARPSCAKHARPKVRPGGYLVLDNAERATYARIQRDLQSHGWRASHYYGPAPYNWGFSQTSIFHQPGCPSA